MQPPRRRLPQPDAWSFLALAILLLALAISWRIPMMLWDHLDLVPIYRAWMHGELSASDMVRSHGGHFHAAAYATLLATTSMSGGRPWLDVLASWLLLVGYAWIVLAIARRTIGAELGTPRSVLFLLVFLALYPGHLANLQWGWQVAVFLCLSCAAAVIALTALAPLSVRNVAVCLAAAALAVMSFATALALIPTALILIALRRDAPPPRRLACAVPWLLAAAIVAIGQRGALPSEQTVDAVVVVHYALNFIGGGIARFATDAAPWLALAGIASAALALRRRGAERAGLPWLGLMLFALFGALLAALARSPAYGADQAFATRYVSFSSMFWLGWTGVIALTVDARTRRAKGIALGFVAVLAIFNSAQMISKAAHLSAHTRQIAATIRATYPQVDEAILAEIYFDQPSVARDRLDGLHALGFAPFDAAGMSESGRP